jgi:DNA-binding MarR family transcriptional regulator
MSLSNLPVLPCICSSFRRAARGLTQLYEAALRPLGLRATQFTVLQVLSQAGEISQGRLGEMLAMDSTSLTRTLDIMVRQGWITERRGEDRRERRLRLSDAGEVQLNRALPAWEEVQARLRDRLGEQVWTRLEELTYQVTTVATTHTTPKEERYEEL